MFFVVAIADFVKKTFLISSVAINFIIGINLIDLILIAVVGVVVVVVGANAIVQVLMVLELSHPIIH